MHDHGYLSLFDHPIQIRVYRVFVSNCGNQGSSIHFGISENEQNIHLFLFLYEISIPGYTEVN